MSEVSTDRFPQEFPRSRFVEVALPIPLQQTFTYSIPVEMQGRIDIGARLLVPFGSRRTTGYAILLHEQLGEESGLEKSDIKPVFELLDASPLLTDEIIKLTQWTAGYYASSWGEMLKASLPAGINATVEEVLNVTQAGKDAVAETVGKRAQRYRMLEFLTENGETSGSKLRKKFGTTKARRLSNELLNLGYVEKQYRTITTKVKPKKQQAVRLIPNFDNNLKEALTASQKKIVDFLEGEQSEALFTELISKTETGRSPVNTLAKRGIVEIFEKELRRDPFSESESGKVKDITLTDEQAFALSEIKKSVSAESFQTFLLHGVTGSGKTEIYIRAMKDTLDRGKSALMLVPEIALTPMFSRRLRAVFGDDVAILHSSLSTGERFDEWRRIRNGDANVVIGTRSAIFAPLQNLGLIVIDEEHDSSYRQHEMPFYNARDVAIVRANRLGAVAILGSATPAIESYYNAQKGKYKYLNLPYRIGDRPLAQAEIVDMRMVFESEGKDPILAPDLVSEIEKTHKRGEQSIILLNRRGFSQFVLCRSCGESIRCTNCDITLTYHKRDQRLICHYCNYRIKAPKLCPSCDSKYLFFVGEGTEQIENLLQRKFSDLRIARVDRDTTRRRRELEKVLHDFGKGDLDMLVGTQMIAKGHDFHNVTLVGVISVDTGLSMPDFRSAERTFQLLTQVAGRAGRGDLHGRVLIQTYHPDHYALRHAKTQSYESFYDEEIAYRERMHYPPFVSLASILIKHPNYNYAFDSAQILRDSLDSANSERKCIILGPAPAPLARLKGEHRLQILLKSRNRKLLRNVIDIAAADARENFCDMKIVYIEIDPVNLL